MHQLISNTKQATNRRGFVAIKVLKLVVNVIFSLSVLILWCTFIIAFTVNNGEMVVGLNPFFQIGYIIGAVAVGTKILWAGWGPF